LTGKGVMAGNNVSHANNKTRRRYLPNLQVASLLSEALDQTIRMRLTASAIRTVDKRGGLDAFLLLTADGDLSTEARAIKKRVQRARAAKASS
jgi:large subunit ribosomal protein L28